MAEVYSDGELRIILHETSNVPNKHKKGGQSQQRYQRCRENEITQWFKRIRELSKTIEGGCIIGISDIYYPRFKKYMNKEDMKRIKYQFSGLANGVAGIYDLNNKINRLGL